tara:strand:- start:1370 stop:1621 length:252 start_codon:yes stop_codon:yes gene_type:complete
MAHLIKALPNKKTKVELNGGLKQRQQLVDGYIEYVSLKNGDSLIVNEEGRLRDLPLNQIASNLAGKIITGDVILISKVEMLNE